MAADGAGVGEQGVAAVQEPELALLERGDVVDKRAPASSQRGRPAGNAPAITHSLNGSVATGAASV